MIRTKWLYIAWLAALLFAPRSPADEKSASAKSAAELFPATTWFYAEMARPQQVLDVVLDHPLRPKVEALDGIRQAYERKEYLEFRAVVALVEAQTGMPWRKLVETISGDGIYLSVEGPSGGVAVLVKSADQAKLEMLLETLLKLARDDARQKGNADPIPSVEYRGIRAHRVDETRIATLGPWLLLVNQSDLGKQIVDAYLDGNPKSLANSEHFLTARSTAANPAALWAFANLSALREAGVGKSLFQGRADNPGAELLAGGLLSTLQKAPYATAEAQLTNQQLQLLVSMPHDHSWVAETRHYFFGADGKGAAPATLVIRDLLFSLGTYRDVSQMWLRAADLFDEQTNEGLAQADSNLTTLFSGKDFGEDILGAVRPEIQIVATRQSFAETPAPAIKLPAFAIVFRLKDPQAMQPEMRRLFQSLIGFFNVAGAMNGQPQLDQDIERDGNKQIVSAKFIPQADEKDSKQAKINFNFSPSIGFMNDWFVVSSTRQLAREVVDAVEKTVAQASTQAVKNTAARIDLPVLRSVLNDNRDQLVAQNMLEEGHSKAEADAAIGVLLSIADWFRNASLDLDVAQKRVDMKLEINLKDSL